VLNEALEHDAVSRFPEITVFGMNSGVIKTDILAGAIGKASLVLRLQQTVVGLLFQSAETCADKVLPLMANPAGDVPNRGDTRSESSGPQISRAAMGRRPSKAFSIRMPVSRH